MRTNRIRTSLGLRMGPRRRLLALVGLGLRLVSLLVLISPRWVAAEALPIVRYGDPSPDGNGTFGDYWSTFSEPCLNDSGQVGFGAYLSGTAGGFTDDEALFRGKPGSPPTLLVREGQSLPTGGAFGGGLSDWLSHPYAMNNSGCMAFDAVLTGTPGGATDNAGIYSSAGPGTLAEHVRKGAPAPGMGGGTFTGFWPPQINNDVPANISFIAGVGGWGTVYIARGSTPSFIVRVGQPPPDGNGWISRFYIDAPPAICPNGAEVRFWAHLDGTVEGTVDDDGVFGGNAGAFSITQIARGGQPAPGGGQYGEVAAPVSNALGFAAFKATRVPTLDDVGIYIASGQGGGRRIAHTGQLAPDLNGTFYNFHHPALSAGNLTAFTGDLEGTAGGFLDRSGVYRGEVQGDIFGSVILIQLARANQLVPEGDGRFNTFGDIVGINAPGQVLFTATLRGTPGGNSDDRGLYLWDEEDGLCKLLREGDVIDGQRVVGFETLNRRDYGGFRCLNDAGLAVARVDMAGVVGDGVYLIGCPSSSAVETPRQAAPSAARLEFEPHPFGAEPLTLHYMLPSAPGTVRIQVHDVTGRLVRTLLDSPAPASGTLRWDGRAEGNRPLAAGVYFLRLDSPGATVVRRAVRLAQ